MYYEKANEFIKHRNINIIEMFILSYRLIPDE